MVTMQHHVIKDVRKDNFVLSKMERHIAKIIVEMVLLLELNFFMEVAMMLIEYLEMDVINVLLNHSGCVIKARLQYVHSGAEMVFYKEQQENNAMMETEEMQMAVQLTV